MKEYWEYLFAGDIDVFDGVYSVDLKTILNDIYTTIQYVKDKTEINKKGFINYGDLYYVCEEFVIFIKKTLKPLNRFGQNTNL